MSSQDYVALGENEAPRLTLMSMLGLLACGAFLGTTFTLSMQSNVNVQAVHLSSDPKGTLARCQGTGVKLTVCDMDHALVQLPRNVSYQRFEAAMQPFWTNTDTRTQCPKD